MQHDNGLVPVRRLFGGDAESDTILQLPKDRAARLIEDGVAVRVFPATTPEPAGPQPIANRLRTMLGTDGEIRGLLATLQTYCLRGLARYDERRPAAVHRLRRTRASHPGASFTRSIFAGIGGKARLWNSIPSFAASHDPKLGMIAWHLRRRVWNLLTGEFGGLRAGRLLATGISPTAAGRTGVSPDVWSASTAIFSLEQNALKVGDCVLFVDVVASPAALSPAALSPASRSALGKFIAVFDAEMAAVQRRFTVDELAAAARRHLGDSVSAREIAAAVRRASPPAWTNSGRRPAGVVPCPAELDAAGRAARQAMSGKPA